MNAVTLRLFKDHEDVLQVEGVSQEKQIPLLIELLQPQVRQVFDNFFKEHSGKIILIGPLEKMKREPLKKVMEAFAKYGGVEDILENDLPPAGDCKEYLDEHGDCYGFLNKELQQVQKETGIQIDFEWDSLFFSREDTVLVELVAESADADPEYVSCPRPVVLLEGKRL